MNARRCIFHFLQILTLRENIVESRLLLGEILSRLTKPGENDSRTEGDPVSPVRINYDEEVFPVGPEDELSTDDTDLVDAQAVPRDTPTRTKGGHEKLRILADLHKRRLLSVDSARSMTDEDSFDSTL